MVSLKLALSFWVVLHYSITILDVCREQATEFWGYWNYINVFFLNTILALLYGYHLSRITHGLWSDPHEG